MAIDATGTPTIVLLFFNLMANKKCFAVAKHFVFVIRENFCIFSTTGLDFCPMFCVVDTVRANAWHYESKISFFHHVLGVLKLLG